MEKQNEENKQNVEREKMPTKMEVISEMGLMVKSAIGSPLGPIKNGAGHVYDFARKEADFFRKGLLASTELNYLLSSGRMDSYLEDFPEKSSEVFPATIGFFGGLATQRYAYYHLVKEGHPEALLFPLMTNLASGVYEWQRKAKEHLAEKKSLESKIDGGEE